MQSIHPKVAWASVVGLGWTAVCLALSQYAPHASPNAALTAAVGTLLTALAGYWAPQSAPTA
jgi:hypothetical protein